MKISYSFPALLVFYITAWSHFEPALSSSHCGRSLQVVDDKVGVIRSSVYHSWSFCFGSMSDGWIITGPEDEPIVLSFSQFSVRCKKEWVSINSSAGGDPIILCGSKLPQPIELPGGNITVTHHFLPHLFPVSSFLLNYARDPYEGDCPESSFKCYGGRCLPLSWRCNGQVECLDEESDDNDELGCDCPCGGLLQTFYGTFSPPGCQGQSKSCVWTLDPQDSRPLRLELQKLTLAFEDRLTVYNREEGKGDIIKTITSSSNSKSVQVESNTGVMSVVYKGVLGTENSNFNATFHVKGYCPPWEGRCGGAAEGCFTQEQHCDGKWDCPETGKDEEGCRNCSPNHFPCGMAGQRTTATSKAQCYSLAERCNYQLNCADGSDERDCTVCQPGTFHCDSDRCVYESWRCDGQVDCKDGTDELNCTVILPRKVITAATVGSLVCGLLLVIAMGCTCKLYSLRTREYSMFAPINRHEAELIQQQAPPSYGQLIAQGIIPPVEDFPIENPNETSTLSLRGILQLLRQDAASSPHRRRRPRFIRRAVRRLRRWGLIPRSTSRQTQSSSSNQQQAQQQQQSDTATSGQETARSTPGSSPSAVEAVNQPVAQKLGLLAQPVQQQLEAPPPLLPLPSPPPIAFPPPPPYAPPAPPVDAPHTPPVAVPPSSPSLASIFHTIGLSISRFRASPSSTNYVPLSASPSFSSTSSSSDDDVLLIPLSEDNTSEDDVPMLT